MLTTLRRRDIAPLIAVLALTACDSRNSAAPAATNTPPTIRATVVTASQPLVQDVAVTERSVGLLESLIAPEVAADPRYDLRYSAPFYGLVDITNQRRQQGLGVDAALLAACPVRLRPVLMTSLTVILAMVPAALGVGAGSETNGPLAIAVIGGMLSSTLLTLVVIPPVYSILEGFLEWWQAHRAIA
ncbi:MAG: efflux RND transporter permease subunit [Porticoccaceae bacterium]